MSDRTVFDGEVPACGYSWWYIDAASDDGLHGLTVIGFVGSVFSPYYAWSRALGGADASNHCALNVVLYGHGSNRWAMTERGRDSVIRTPHLLSIGPSEIRRSANGLSVRVDEVAGPVPRRLRGCVEVQFGRVFDRSFDLDGPGRHRWQPIAPLARVEVAFDQPSLRWSGSAYVDSNWGDEPLERAFSGWQWSRTSGNGTGTSVYYDVRRVDGSSHYVGVRFDPAGSVIKLDRPHWTNLGTTGWRIGRFMRAERPESRWSVTTLEDTPFYARTLVRRADRAGTETTFHESLDLRRFSNPVVQLMLPFRMPRRA